VSLKFRSRNVSIRVLFIAVALGAAAGGACTPATILPHKDAGAGGDTGVGGESGIGGATGAGGATTPGTGGHGTGGNGAAGSGAGGTTGAGGTGVAGTGAGGTGAGGVATGGGAGSVSDGGSDGPTGITPNARGQLVITEIMADTVTANDDNGEWLEIYNPSSQDTYDLFQCSIADTNNAHQIANHVLVRPHAFVTLARFNSLAGGFIPDYFYLPPECVNCGTMCPASTCVKFSNTGGDLARLACTSVIVDEVVFSSLSWLKNGLVPHGRSYSLDPSHYSATDNDAAGNWCTGTVSYFGSDLGSPGATNPTCTCSLPPVSTCDFGM
jgi:hypothetical protein